MKFTQFAIFAGLLELLAACSPHGRHYQLYGAIQTYGVHLTIEQADQLVDDITKRVSSDTGNVVQLRDSEAETVAVGFARGKVATNRWTDAAGFAWVMVQLQTGRFTSGDQTENFLQAASVLSSAYSEPSTAPERLSGLLNGTQAEKVVSLSGGDVDAARTVLNDALLKFFSH